MKRHAQVFVAVAIVAFGAYALGRKHGRLQPGPLPGLEHTRDMTPPTNPPLRTFAEQIHTALGQGFTRNAPFVENVTSAQKGYEAARANLEEALKQMEGLPVAERLGFVTGVFSFVATHHSPAEGLKIYHRLPEASRPNALRALVAEWIYARSPIEVDMRYLKREGTRTINGSRLGLEVELSAMLASSQPDAELTTAWLDGFSNHPARSGIFTALVSALPQANPDAVLSRTEHWTPWEKERAVQRFASNWAASGGSREAWDWYQSKREQLGPGLGQTILEPWAASDPKAVEGLLASLEEPRQRENVIQAIGKVLARKDTDQAVIWAETFANDQEREVAQRAIYEGAPRGVGAVLTMENGFPTLKGIVPGSPLENTGARPGDQLVEVRSGDGAAQALYGKDLNTIVNLIRGEAGSEMILRILRRDPASSQFEEHLIPVKRDQLYLKESALPKD